jgi:hypothetical protein
MWLNTVLRAGGRAAAKQVACNFRATISSLNSAIKKLARVTPLPATKKLYRGLSGMALPPEVLVRRRFVELAFSSATTDKEVAQSYAGCDRAYVRDRPRGHRPWGRHLCLLPYPEEKEHEHVIPPLSHFEISRVRREGSINCYVLKLNINQRARTLEELRMARKRVVQRLAKRLQFEEAEMSIPQPTSLSIVAGSDVEPVGSDWFNDPANFKNVVCKLVDAFAHDVRARFGRGCAHASCRPGEVACREAAAAPQSWPTCWAKPRQANRRRTW